MKKDYTAIAKKKLQNQITNQVLLVITCLLGIIQVTLRQSGNAESAGTLCSMVLWVVFIVFLLPISIPVNDQQKIQLYADYLEKLDELEKERQAHKDFVADNGA